MKHEKVLKRIKRAAEKCRILHLTVAFDRGAYSALPLFCSEKFFFGLAYGDFRFDGYWIVRNRDILSAKPLNPVLTYIVEREGLIKGIAAPPVDLTSWRDVFRSLMERNQSVMVETRPDGKGKRSCGPKEGAFFIGRILKIRKRSIDLLHFNAYGEWDGAPTKLRFKDMSAVRFENRYASVFSKYVGEPPAKENE